MPFDETAYPSDNNAFGDDAPKVHEVATPPSGA